MIYAQFDCNLKALDLDAHEPQPLNTLARFRTDILAVERETGVLLLEIIGTKGLSQ